MTQVHDLHFWEITSGQTARSAHVLVDLAADCHQVRERAERLLHDLHEVTHTTLQVDHDDISAGQGHCVESHGPVHRSDRQVDSDSTTTA